MLLNGICECVARSMWAAVCWATNYSSLDKHIPQRQSVMHHVIKCFLGPPWQHGDVYSQSGWRTSFCCCIEAAFFPCPCYFCLNNLKTNKKQTPQDRGSPSSIYKGYLLDITLRQLHSEAVMLHILQLQYYNFSSFGCRIQWCCGLCFGNQIENTKSLK